MRKVKGHFGVGGSVGLHVCGPFGKVLTSAMGLPQTKNWLSVRNVKKG
jgi:hypothetical protein